MWLKLELYEKILMRDMESAYNPCKVLDFVYPIYNTNFHYKMIMSDRFCAGHNFIPSQVSLTSITHQ